MSVSREKKESLIGEISEAFRQNETFYLIDFVNLRVSQSMELRRILRDNSYSFKVVKNRLALRALSEGSPEGLREHFRGPTGIAFAPENPIHLARLLKDFSTQNKVLTVKAGMIEGQFLAAERFGEIANLTSRDDLLAKMGFLLSHPLIKLLRTWQAPLNSVGSLLSQYKLKK